MRREEWNRKYAESGLLWTATPNRFLVAEVEGLLPGNALDLACGEGRNAFWLAGRGWHVTGVDFSDVAVAKARELAAHEHLPADFVCADLVEHVPDEQAYDLVIVFYLHVPAEQRRLVLERAAAAVALGGTFLLVGHDLANLSDGTGGPSDPAVLYTADEIADELPGLTVEKAERVLRDVEDADRPAIDVLVRARRGAPA